VDGDRAFPERPPEVSDPISTARSQDRGVGSSAWLRRWLRILLFAFAVCAAAIILYGLVQLFICDFREVVFPDLPRRGRWLCP
jgi:hypothetical protein